MSWTLFEVANLWAGAYRPFAQKNILFKILEFFGHQFNDFLKKTNCQNFIIIKYIVQADSKIYIWGCFNFSPSCFINSQTWLNQLMDDHHPNYITKVEKRQKNKTPLHSAYMWIPLPICSKHTHTHTHIHVKREGHIYTLYVGCVYTCIYIVCRLCMFRECLIDHQLMQKDCLVWYGRWRVKTTPPHSFMSELDCFS
jgi:hypothetical protein